MVMKNRKKILIISLTLLASFTSAAETVTKGMKKVIDDALDFLSNNQCPCSMR